MQRFAWNQGARASGETLSFSYLVWFTSAHIHHEIQFSHHERQKTGASEEMSCFFKNEMEGKRERAWAKKFKCCAEKMQGKRQNTNVIRVIFLFFWGLKHSENWIEPFLLRFFEMLAHFGRRHRRWNKNAETRHENIFMKWGDTLWCFNSSSCSIFCPLTLIQRRLATASQKVWQLIEFLNIPA